jgi:hypothetical protein
MSYAGDRRSDESGFYGDDDEGREDRSNSIFTADSNTANSSNIVQGAAPITLVDVVTADNVPQLVTVNLAAPVGGVTVPAIPSPASYAETIALLDFGVGSSPYHAEVDYGTGIQFAMLINRLKISAEFRTLDGTLTPAVPPSLLLAASVGPGTVSVVRAPTRTLAYTWVAPSVGMPPSPAVGSYVVFTVPMFAKSMISHARATAGVPVLAVTTFSAMYKIISATPVVVWPSEEIWLPGDARMVQLSNVGGVNVFDVRIVFLLQL